MCDSPLDDIYRMQDAYFAKKPVIAIIVFKMCHTLSACSDDSDLLVMHKI
jgi:hypothetical protein